MKHLFNSLQWMLFMLMGSIVIPVAVAGSFNLDPADIVSFVARTLFVLGIAGILQACFGHKLPIQEGPAGVWWGIFVLYAGIGSMMFGSNTETLRVLEFCFILSGIIFIILSPLITSYFAALPIAVGFASLVPTFGIGMFMIGIMFLPAAAFKGMPPALVSLLSNGLIVGTFIAVLMDRINPSMTIAAPKAAESAPELDKKYILS